MQGKRPPSPCRQATPPLHGHAAPRARAAPPNPPGRLAKIQPASAATPDQSYLLLSSTSPSRTAGAQHKRPASPRSMKPRGRSRVKSRVKCPPDLQPVPHGPHHRYPGPNMRHRKSCEPRHRLGQHFFRHTRNVDRSVDITQAWVGLMVLNGSAVALGMLLGGRAGGP